MRTARWSSKIRRKMSSPGLAIQQVGVFDLVCCRCRIKQHYSYLERKMSPPPKGSHTHPLAGLSRSWAELPASILHRRPEELADLALRHVHESHSLKAFMLVQDMYRSQGVLEIQEQAMWRLESLIRTVRSVSEADGRQQISRNNE